MQILKKEWNIKPRRASCLACGRDFEQGESCFSALDARQDEWERSDYCRDCWQATGQEKEFVCTWRGCFHPPETDDRDEPLKRHTAESLFRRLVETDLPEHMGVIYVLAVMLERGRTLKEIEVRDIAGGWRVRLYEHRRSGEAFLVTDPELRLEALDEVQQQVVSLLDPPADAPQHETAPAAQDGRNDHPPRAE